MPLLLLPLIALAPHAAPHTGPDPGLNDAVRMASAVQWNAAVTWDATVQWNDTIAWNQALAAQQPPPPPKSTAPPSAPPRVRASAPPTSSSSGWDAVAACESGGNWSISTGNGYYGGLQMTMDFWNSHGGGQYAARPDLATKAEQIAVANQAGSRSPWPVCGSR